MHPEEAEREDYTKAMQLVKTYLCQWLASVLW